jgi:hypothetical protein
MGDDEQKQKALTEAHKAAIKVLSDLALTLLNVAQVQMNTTGSFMHSTVVTISAEILNKELERCLKTKFISLSGELEDRLFDRALQSLGPKIDLAYALAITNQEIHLELRKILTIRNRFAHETQLRELKMEDVSGLRRYGAETDKPLQMFINVFVEINDFLEKFLVANGVTENISPRNSPRP